MLFSWAFQYFAVQAQGFKKYNGPQDVLHFPADRLLVGMCAKKFIQIVIIRDSQWTNLSNTYGTASWN